MSDQTRMTLLHSSTNNLVEELLMWRGRAYQLLDRVAELEEKQRWRVVADGELPEDGEVVWLWDGNNLGMGYYLVFSGQFMDRYTPLRPIKPSHWLPLPESPEVQE